MPTPKEFRPRLPYLPALVRLAGLNRRTPTHETLVALESHIENNRGLLKRGHKLYAK